MNDVNDKALTIAVPIYNVESYLTACLESISLAADCLDQIEVLMIDDGSTDGCPRICLQFEKEYPESFKYVHKENGHYGTAVNLAIEKATGTYFKILDGDDLVNPLGLSKLVDFASCNSAVDLILTDRETIFDETGQCLIADVSARPATVALFDEAPFEPVSMHSMTVRTSILKKMPDRLDPGVAYTDAEFVIFPMPFVQSYVYIPEVVYRYRRDRPGQSMDSANYASQIPAHRKVANRLLDWYDHMLIRNPRVHLIEYSEKHIASFLEDHMQMCLIASSLSISFKDDFLDLEKCALERDGIYQLMRSKSALILRLTNYMAFMPLSLLKRT